MGAQAHGVVLTLVHYTRRMGDRSTPELSAGGGERDRKGDPGEELRGPTMKLRSSGLAISWLEPEGFELEEAPCQLLRPRHTPLSTGLAAGHGRHGGPSTWSGPGHARHDGRRLDPTLLSHQGMKVQTSSLNTPGCFGAARGARRTNAS